MSVAGVAASVVVDPSEIGLVAVPRVAERVVATTGVGVVPVGAAGDVQAERRAVERA